MKSAFIDAVEYYLPEKILTNGELADRFPEWTEEKIENKLGILSRPIAGENELASDLAVRAAKKLFITGACDPSDIDFVLFCTQSPDYLLPTTACLIQERLGLPQSVGALDFNLGCSGWTYGLGLAKGLIETNQANKVLLLTGETYSKYLASDDKATRTIFGDAGAATLISVMDSATERLGPFTYGTDGKGAKHLIVENNLDRSSCGSIPTLDMNGSEVFSFSAREVPKAIDGLLSKVGMSHDDVDLFIFHQANAYMLSFLQKKCGIPSDKFYTWFATTGNTVSSTIPIALHHAIKDHRIHSNDVVMFVGFGVGFSWSACLARF